MLTKLKEIYRLEREVGFHKLKTISGINKHISPLIRGYVTVHVISCLQQLRVFEGLADDWKSADLIANEFGLDLKVARPVFGYLNAIGVLVKKNDKYKLSSYGKFLSINPHGFFSLYLAYDPVFAGLKSLITGQKIYGSDINRDERLMVVGSSEVIKWLPIPAIINWIKKHKVNTLLDFGCGAGDFLSEIRKETQIKHLWGVDRSAAIIDVAKARNPGESHSPIQYLLADALVPDDISRVAKRIQPDAITIMFVLHEVAFVGNRAVIQLLGNLISNFPKAHLYVCETYRLEGDNGQSREMKGHELQLFHALSNQRLLSIREWDGLFHEAGYEIEGIKRFDLMGQAYFHLKPR